MKPATRGPLIGVGLLSAALVLVGLLHVLGRRPPEAKSARQDDRRTTENAAATTASGGGDRPGSHSPTTDRPPSNPGPTAPLGSVPGKSPALPAAIEDGESRARSLGAAGGAIREQVAGLALAGGGYRSAAAGVSLSDDRMLFLLLRLDERAIAGITQKVVAARMRLPSDFTVSRGIYHRVMSADGRVLAHGLAEDPRGLYFDEPHEDGSGRLRGGRIERKSCELAVRYPWIDGAQRVEFFEVADGADIGRITVGEDSYRGSTAIEFPGP